MKFVRNTIFLLFGLVACDNNSPLIPAQDDFALSCTTVILTTDESTKLSVINVNTKEEVDSKVVWSSSDNDVATVDNGTVIGCNIGNATIFAKIGSLTLCCDVNVIARKRLIKEMTLTGGKFTFFYDDQSRLREINGENSLENNPDYKSKAKVFVEYLEDGKAALVLKEIVENKGVETGGTRYEYELTFNAAGKPVRAKNVFDESYSIGITYNSAGAMTGKNYFTDYYEYPQMVLVQHNLNYEYFIDGGIKSIWDGKDKLYEYTYDLETTPEYVNYFQISAFDFGFTDFVFNMIVGFPGGNLVASETVGAGTEYYSYEFDDNGYVTKIMADFNPNPGFSDHKYLISKDYLIAYVNAGDTSYERKDPYVYKGMGGKTYVYTEYYEGIPYNWYLTFLDASRFYFIEDEGDYQDIICGTYTQNGSKITMKIHSTHDDVPDEDNITIGTVSGDTIHTEGGYFGDMSLTLTDNLIL